jgi:heptosyltransferase-3
MKHLLIIHRGSLGDFLLLLPTLGALRCSFPEARIEILGRPEILSLVKPGLADSIASVERASLVPFFEDSTDLPEKESRFFSSFDAVLAYITDPEQTFRHNLERLGIETIVISPPFPPDNEKLHVGRYLFESIGIFLEREPAPDHIFECAETTPSQEARGYGFETQVSSGGLLHFKNNEIQWARDSLASALPGRRPIIAVHPGSGSERKCWPPEKFERLTQWLRKQGDYDVLLILGPADERLVKHMTVLAGTLGCAIADSLPLRHLAALLSQCRAYAGNDSGVTHLAAATGAPTLCIFGPTDPALWAPPGAHVRIIRNNTDCSPCTRDMMYKCNDRICLDRIEVESVADAIHELLSESAHS